MPHQPFSIRSLVKAIQTRPRLLTSIVVGLLSIAAIPATWQWPALTQMTVGWNVGALLYLILAMHMMFGSTHERMCKRAVREDDGRLILLAMVVMSALTCLAAIVAELALAKTVHSSERNWHIGLAALTIFSSWVFTQIMFALHYAHDYYLAEAINNTGGLKFPGDHAPDYGDFLYAACVIGTSGQPADVSFTSRTQRRVGLLHSVLSFFFNTVVVALTINIASGLF
jgi:uncharacterized membrane protein